jgi:hypothetical protein
MQQIECSAWAFARSELPLLTTLASKMNVSMRDQTRSAGHHQRPVMV